MQKQTKKANIALVIIATTIVLGLGLITLTQKANIEDSSIVYAQAAEPVQFSAGLWIMPKTSIISKAIAVKDDEARIVTNSSGNVGCQVHNGADWQDGATSTTALQLNEWAHIACVYDRSAIKMYLNGVEEAETALAVDINDTSNNWQFGRDASNVYGYFKGRMDEIRMYNYARSPAQVAWDFNYGKPIAHWKMDEGQDTATTCEATGSKVYVYIGSHNALINNSNDSPATSTMWSVGKFNCALGLDGVDDFVDIPEQGSIESPARTDEITVSLWANPDTITGSESDEDTMFYSEQCIIRFEGSDDIETFIIGDAAEINVFSVDGIWTTDWQHIVLTFDNDYLRIYRNGVEVGNTNAYSGDGIGEDQISCTAHTRIGAYCGSYQEFYDGLVDDIRVYNYALTPKQIEMLYNQGSAVRFGPSSGLP